MVGVWVFVIPGVLVGLGAGVRVGVTDGWVGQGFAVTQSVQELNDVESKENNS